MSSTPDFTTVELLQQEDQKWLSVLAETTHPGHRIAFRGEAKSATAEDVLKAAEFLDPKIGRSPDVVNFCENLRRAGLYLRNENISEPLAQALLEFRALIIQTLEADADPVAEQSQLSEDEKRKVEKFFYSFFSDDTGATKLDEDEREQVKEFFRVELAQEKFSLRTEKALGAIAHKPLEFLCNAYAHRGLTALNNIQQLTEDEARTNLDGGEEEMEMAQDIGFPLPKEPMLMADFLHLEERKERLRRLREAGDIEAVAAYENECLRAILSTGIGYASLNGQQPNDNRSIRELVESKKRACGGSCIQTSYWLGELGIEAFGFRCDETMVGGEGHRSFIVRDSKGDFFIFDPAMKIVPTPLPQGLFPDNLDEFFGELASGQREGFKLSANDHARAYSEKVNPHVVMKRIDRQVRELLLNAVLQKLPAEERKRLFAVLEKMEGNRGIPVEDMEMKIQDLIADGNKDEARALAQETIANNPDAIITQRNLGEFLLNLGDPVGATDALMLYCSKLIATYNSLDKAILVRLATDSAPGKRTTPVAFRREQQAETIAWHLQAIGLLYWTVMKLPESEGKTKMLTIFSKTGDHLYVLFLNMLMNYRRFLLSRGFLKEDEAWTALCGKGTEQYVRLLHFRALASS